MGLLSPSPQHTAHSPEGACRNLWHRPPVSSARTAVRSRPSVAAADVRVRSADAGDAAMAVRVELTAAKDGGATDDEHDGTKCSDRMASDACGRDMGGERAISGGTRGKGAGGAPHVEWGAVAAAAKTTSGSTDRVARKRAAMTGVKREMRGKAQPKGTKTEGEVVQAR